MTNHINHCIAEHCYQVRKALFLDMFLTTLLSLERQRCFNHNVVDDVAGGCHGGAAANDTRMSHRGTHQTASPNGFVSD